LTVQQREKVLQGWASSPLLLLRKAYRGFVALTLFVAYNSIEDVVLAAGYPAHGDPKVQSESARIKPSYPFKFESIVDNYQYIDTEVLVIGSGAGGGVVSSELARKGWKVLVVEKGMYVPNEEMTSTPAHGLKTLFQSQGVMVNEDGSMNVLAGSSFLPLSLFQ
jgi:long-chain-alcohol oxidase